MQKRVLGKTGLEVSVFGFGGIVVNEMEQTEAKNLVAEAVDRGINFFDVGPTYGNAQERLGPALEPYRQQVILACKTEPEQTKKEVIADLQNSLKLLKTDYFDLYQLHAADNPEHLQKALGPGGALEAIVEAQEQGLVRYIGFSSHCEETALKLINQFEFDTVIFPINWNCWLSTGLGQKVLKKAQEKDMGRLAIKILAHRNWKEGENRGKTWYKPINDNRELAGLAVKFTLSRSVDIAISPGDPEMLRMGLDIIEEVKEFGYLSEEELNRLKKYTQESKPLSFE